MLARLSNSASELQLDALVLDFLVESSADASVSTRAPRSSGHWRDRS